MLHRVVFTAAIVVLAGCASLNKQPISKETSVDLRGQRVAQAKGKTPDFGAITAGSVAFGLLGSMSMNSEGNKLVVEHDISDPADSVAQTLLSALASALAIEAVGATAPVAVDDPVQISAAADGSRFVLYVRTMDWGFGYLPLDWTRYTVYYKAKAQLIDATRKSIIAEGFCYKTAPEKSSDAPTYDELFANQAIRLKSHLSAAANECAKTLQSEMLPL